MTTQVATQAGGRRQIAADSALLLVTLIWGATFVMVKDAVAAVPVFTFMALRFTMAALALTPLIMWRRGQLAAAAPTGPFAGDPYLSMARLRRTLLPSLLVGAALFTGYAFQTAGLQLTTPAKAGFITGLSVAIVPIASALLLRRSPSANAWLGVALATAGLALLSLTADLSIQTGDMLVFCCAVAYAVHILLLGHFAPRHDPVLLTLGQLVAVAIFSIAAALLFDSPARVNGQVIFAATFTGILATAVAFGVQTVAQRFTTTTHTALIFAAEPVFAGLFSYALTGEVLGPRQLAGCGLILGGMLLAEFKRR